MANISAELAAIMQAVYGQQVRSSIHDAIKKINDVSDVVFTTGTEIDSQTSPSDGFFESSLYLNTDTMTLWKCIGTNLWQDIGTLKGPKGEPGNKWYRGTQVGAGSLTAELDANENDNYINTTEGKVYHCTVGGNPSTWEYDMTLSGGGGGGASDWSELENKPFNTVGSDFKTTSGTLALAKKIIDKLSEIDNKEDKHIQLVASCSGAIATVTNETYIGTDYLLEEYIDNPNAYVKSRSISGNTLTLEFSDTVTSCVVIAIKKGV